MFLTWLRPAVDWSVWLANWGPSWLPLWLRKLPLRALVVVIRLAVAVGGMGVVTPMKAQQGPASPSGRGHPALPTKDGASRPDKRYSFISRGNDFRRDE